MKKFINLPEAVVEEMLQGFSVLHPGSARLAGHKVMIRANLEEGRDRQVALLSGGGSGHEPAHAGYIGNGMLSGAVLGEVFTSPSSDSIFAGIQAVAGKPGVLLIVKNYTGDRLNFGLAAEMARAAGIAVETVIVDDDVALKGRGQSPGARGLAGTVFIHKLLGAAASEGRTVTELAKIGKEAVGNLATMGVSFTGGTSPTVGRPSFILGEQEMEIGLGIHGEPGVQRAETQPANRLIEMLLGEILKHGQFGDSKRIAVMLNNLGATTEMELAVVASHAVPFLANLGFTVERIYAGTFLSSLDMAGISVSVLGLNDERLRWLDAPTSAPAWPNASKQRPGRAEAAVSARRLISETKPVIRTKITEQGKKTRRAIEAACRALIDAESTLTELDRITGDGDLGVNMARAARAVQHSVSAYPLDDIADTLKALGHTLQRELGGTSGPLYGVFFLRCGNALGNGWPRGLLQWAKALDQGCRAIRELGGAKPGDRTMLDALEPFVNALQEPVKERSPLEAMRDATAAAERGAIATARMLPALGRSSYLGERVLGHPDPGAKAFAIWLRASCESLSGG